MVIEVDKMRRVQLKQVQALTVQLALPDDKGTHAAVCLAHLVRPGSSQVAEEALMALIVTLQAHPHILARRRAAWALGKLAATVPAAHLSDRIVPVLIESLQPSPDRRWPDVLLARQVYLSLRQIGTPDAIEAIESYHTRLITARLVPRR